MYLLARARVQYDEAVEAWSTMIGKHGRRANGVRPGAQGPRPHSLTRPNLGSQKVSERGVSVRKRPFSCAVNRPASPSPKST